MIENRLEIFRDGEWYVLELDNRETIKYNAVINRIGKIESREISHTNTFKLNSTKNNLFSLGINIFNHLSLAKALNAKYECRYFVEEVILQTGFLVINTVQGGVISVNFIDESLGILDEWGSTSFKQLIRNQSLNIPSDYIDAINEMKGYVASKTSVLPLLSEVGTRGYNLALFPNNLNAIGDDFQTNIDGDRLQDKFNPYQTRPIFNSKAVFDIACEAYGFTPIFDPSVNWEAMANQYIVSADLNKNYSEEAENQTYSVISGSSDLTLTSVPSNNFDVQSTLVYPMVRSRRPADINGWTDPETGYGTSYLTTNSVFVPDLLQSSVGNILFRATSSNTITPASSFGVWLNETNGQPVIFREIPISNFEIISVGVINFTVSKSDILTPPPNAGEFQGIFTTVLETDVSVNASQVSSVQVTEQFLPVDAISYDDNAQFIDESIDLTYGASDETVKDLLTGLMTKDGILMNIDAKKKEITFFNYGKYLVNIKNDVFEDWSEYLLRYSNYNYNTDFGNKFGRINEIGLSSPYSGNTNIIRLNNQDSASKYKDKAKNLSTRFKDVSLVVRIRNTATPYLEYTNEGLGLVNYYGNIGSITQTRADGTDQGTLQEIPALKNVSFLNAPTGIIAWYNLVDLSVRATPKFLLPVNVVRNIDLTVPVYIEDLGGFYIIEEIAEYTDESTPVNVKLIKVIRGSEFNSDFNNDFNT